MATTTPEGRSLLAINNANSYGNSIQTIIGSINNYTTIPSDLPLPAHINREILQYCRQLHLLISQASLIYPSSTSTKSYCYRIRNLFSSIYEAIAKPRVHVLAVRPLEAHLDTPTDIITKVLLLCGIAIHNFEMKAIKETSFCLTIDLDKLRKSLQDCLYYLFTSLWYIHQTNPLSRDSIAGIDKVVGDMLRCHWQCQNVMIEITRSRFTELENPIILYDASSADTFLPIPRMLCGSSPQMHLFLLTVYGDRPWHKKIEHNEYILESNDLTKEVQAQNWDEVMKPGETIYMTMLVKHKGAMSDTCCRQCRAINVERICGNKKMRCLSCGLISGVTESILEIEGADFASVKEDGSQATPSETLQEPAEQRFLRIRYDCDLPLQNDILPQDQAADDSVAADDWLMTDYLMHTPDSEGVEGFFDTVDIHYHPFFLPWDVSSIPLAISTREQSPVSQCIQVSLPSNRRISSTLSRFGANSFHRHNNIYRQFYLSFDNAYCGWKGTRRS